MRASLLSGALILNFILGCSGTPPSAELPSQAPNPASLEPAPAPVVEAQEGVLPKPSGECIIKPVMSDEDLYNCGAIPRQPRLPRQPVVPR